VPLIGGTAPRRTPTYSSTSLKVSATEWVVSASIAAEPVSKAATALATAMSRFAATATATVRTLASSVWLTTPRADPVRQTAIVGQLQ
jgi:hypothetical protein